MCYFLYVASPLTLSEVRSMLPAGLTADLLGPAEHAMMRRLHPDAQTVARVLHGACSCDLVRQRHPTPGEDESRLRTRYRALGYGRERVIRALEGHRRALAHRPQAAGHWPRSFAAFVAEHARNAGPTLYYLHFSLDGLLQTTPGAPVTIGTAEVRAAPGEWLAEDTPTFVVRHTHE